MVLSGIFRLYIATGFFATLIFFVLNAQLYTPYEIILSVVGVTIVLKGCANLILSLMISLFSLDSKKEELEFNYNEDKINAMLSELQVQDVVERNEKALKGK